MKTYFLIISLAVTVPALAQRHSLLVQTKPSFTYFGKNKQEFKDVYFRSREGDLTLNTTLNLTYLYKMSSKFSLGVGLEYAQQGQDIKFIADSVGFGTATQTMEVELNYVRVPLTVHYNLYSFKKSIFSLYSGVSVGVAVKRSDNYQDIILQFILLPPSEDRYNKTDIAIPIGLNYTHTPNNKLFLNLGVEYMMGVTNTFSDKPSSKFGVLSEFKHSRQNRLALNLGIGFKL